MNSMQKTYHSFVESVCKKFDCTEAIRPLQEGFAALCEAGDRMSGSAWDTVEWIHVYHAADPRMDMDIKLDSLWATRQKDSVTREDVIGRFIEDAEDFNKWLATSEDGGAFVTSAAIKFKGDPEAITVDIPYPGGVEDFVSPSHNSLQESAGSPGSPEIPASFCPTTGAQAMVDTKLRQLGIVVDWSTYTPSRNRSWASQGMPSGTAEAYTVSEAEKAGSYTTYNRRTICFYVSVSKLARTPVDMYDVNDRMGSDYREIGVDTKFVPPENQSSGCPEGECQLRQPTTDELYKFIMKATKEEHQLRGDWDSNHEEIGADSDRFIREIQAGEVQSLTDGRGLVAYGLDSGKMIIYDLYVLPEYRNAGVGGTLLDKVTEMAGGRPVALTVNSMNAPAIQLYRNHGFREVGTVSDNGVELLRMERKLDEA